MALGEQIGEFRGKVTGTRVLPGDDYRYIKMEISWQEEGTLLGMPAQNMGTVEAFERVSGQGYASGQGILFCEAGGVIWNSTGVSRLGGEGMAGTQLISLAVQAPTDGPLARLNSVLIVGEQETDADNNTHTTLWEWK